jgi:hypothetical protein
MGVRHRSTCSRAGLPLPGKPSRGSLDQRTPSGTRCAACTSSETATPQNAHRAPYRRIASSLSRCWLRRPRTSRFSSSRSSSSTKLSPSSDGRAARGRHRRRPDQEAAFVAAISTTCVAAACLCSGDGRAAHRLRVVVVMATPTRTPGSDRACSKPPSDEGRAGDAATRSRGWRRGRH